MENESATASTVLQSMSLMELTPSARSIGKWFVRMCAMVIGRESKGVLANN